MPGNVECYAEVGCERPRQLDAHHRAQHFRRERPSVRGKAIDRDSADEPLRAEIEDHAAGEQERRQVQHPGDRVGGGGEDVLIELQPDVVERFRRAVDVVDPASAAQHVRRGVERCLECVVGALLPVARARSSRGAAHRRGTRQRQLPKRGGVGDGLLKREQQQEHAVLLVSRDYTCGTIRDGHHGEHGIHSGRARERARVRHIQATYTPHPVF